MFIAKRAGRVVAARTAYARQTDADLTAALHEQLGGFRLLRLCGRTRAAGDHIRRLAHRQAVAELNAIRVDQGLAALYTTLLSAGAFFIIWLGGRSVAAGALSVGGLVAFLQLFARFVGRAPRIPQMANRVQAAGAAYARLRDLLAPPVLVGSEPLVVVPVGACCRVLFPESETRPGWPSTGGAVGPRRQVRLSRLECAYLARH